MFSKNAISLLSVHLSVCLSVAIFFGENIFKIGPCSAEKERKTDRQFLLINAYGFEPVSGGVARFFANFGQLY
jgi:hypothetical protein